MKSLRYPGRLLTRVDCLGIIRLGAVELSAFLVVSVAFALFPVVSVSSGSVLSSPPFPSSGADSNAGSWLKESVFLGSSTGGSESASNVVGALF